MMLQRQHAKNPATGELVCTHVRVIHTGVSVRQSFSSRLIEQGILEGWVSVDDKTLTMTAEPSDLIYAVKRRPGYYCKSTGDRIHISDIAWSRFRATGIGDLSRREALAWLATNGKAADDYEVTHAYECVLDANAHERFRFRAAEHGDRSTRGGD